jgi:hypothetical protein
MNSTAPLNSLDAAFDFISCGWNPVPVLFRDKKPTNNGWQTQVIDATNAPLHFNGTPQNVGVMMGQTSNGLTDVDLDCSEAVAIGPYLLPSTRATFGRESKRCSHWLYRTDLADTEQRAAIQFQSPDGDMLLELRIGGGGKGAQTVFPGSVHPTGEPILWEEYGEPAAIDGDDLIRQVGLVAAGCLIARSWPVEGGRHDAALTVGGFLGRAGLSAQQVAVMIEAISRAAGDTEWRDRVRAAKDQFEHYQTTDKARGFPKLVKLVGDGSITMPSVQRPILTQKPRMTKKAKNRQTLSSSLFEPRRPCFMRPTAQLTRTFTLKSIARLSQCTLGHLSCGLQASTTKNSTAHLIQMPRDVL